MMNRIPGGLMLIPLVIGSVLGTFASGFLGLGSFTTALFADSALPLIALLIFATGTQVTLKTSGPVLATAGVVLLCKSVIPATLVILLGTVVGLDGVLGVSFVALLVAVDNSNGGLWLAFTGRYGDKRDRGAYIASALNDGPFFSMLFLGASGLADIPVSAMVAAVIPFLLGMLVGNLNPHWREVLRPTPAIVIPFFALALGTGIDLNNIVTGGAAGLVVGLVVAPVTGFLTYLGYPLLAPHAVTARASASLPAPPPATRSPPPRSSRSPTRALKRYVEYRHRAGGRLRARHRDPRPAPRLSRAQARGRPARPRTRLRSIDDMELGITEPQL